MHGNLNGVGFSRMDHVIKNENGRGLRCSTDWKPWLVTSKIEKTISEVLIVVPFGRENHHRYRDTCQYLCPTKHIT